MKKSLLLILKTIGILLLIDSLLTVNSFAGNKEISPEQKEQGAQLMGNQSVRFLENRGQMTDIKNNPVPFVLFKAEAPGMNMYITEKGLTYMFIQGEEEKEKEAHSNPHDGMDHFSPSGRLGGGHEEEKYIFKCERVDMELKGASIKKANIIREAPSVTDFNFFYPHCPDGIYGVKEYEKITIKDVYSGIDWVFYNSNDKGFKYDFIVHPGADYKQIELLYRSKTPIQINAKGEIELTTKHGDITENTPVSFCEGKKITTRFKQNYQKSITINEDRGYETSISFSIAWDDSQIPPSLREGRGGLIIDPQLVWATFYGGNTYDGPQSITTDAAGNIFIVGYTQSINFPLQDSGGGVYFQPTYGGYIDIFILKFNNTGVRQWATYYGGNGMDFVHFICTDGSGNVFVTGITASANFPLQDPGGGAYYQPAFGGGMMPLF